jgi:hypothetical protein
MLTFINGFSYLINIMSQVPCKATSLNKTDAFILKDGDEIYQVNIKFNLQFQSYLPKIIKIFYSGTLLKQTAWKE